MRWAYTVNGSLECYLPCTKLASAKGLFNGKIMSNFKIYIHQQLKIVPLVYGKESRLERKLRHFCRLHHAEAKSKLLEYYEAVNSYNGDADIPSKEINELKKAVLYNAGWTTKEFDSVIS